MTALNSNAPERFTRDGDFAGYALPEDDPVSIDTKWIKSYGRGPDGFEDADELVYVVRWSNGIWWETYTLPREWHNRLPMIFSRTIAERNKVGEAEGFRGEQCSSERAA